jgi:tryprostatin B 6-hydroxylase
MDDLIHGMIGAALGVGLHRTLFIHGEWHVRAPQIVLYHLAYFALLSLIFAKAHWMIAGYIIALFSSITIYRVFFHRLGHFPGPFWARITKIWHAWKARHRTNYLVLEKAHHQYGDFVRTGKEYKFSGIFYPMLTDAFRTK